MGAKKKKTSNDDVNEPSSTIEKPAITTNEKVIILEFKLLNWKYMNFSVKFRETTPIFTIKKLLRERHGRVEDLKLCLHSFTEANELNDEMLTLLEVGLKGRIPEMKLSSGHGSDLVVDEESIPCFQIYYDFRPVDFSDPIMLFFP